MQDAWHAECLPCNWLEFYDEEDSAIAAAQTHVLHFHADVNNEQRGALKMGHVQLRTVNTTSAGDETTPAPAATHGSPDEPAILPAGSLAPEQTMAEKVAALFRHALLPKE